MSARRLVLPLITALLSASGGVAQTLPSGVINAPPTVIGNNESIGSDTTLNVLDNGTVGNFFAAGLPDGSSTNVLVDITDGIVGNDFHANAGSTVNIRGGRVGTRFDANAGSTVNISGGRVIGAFQAHDNSVVNVSGGRIGNRFFAEFGSTVNLTGGIVGDDSRANSGSTVVVNGGTIGEEFVVEGGSSFALSDGVLGDNFLGRNSSTVDISGGTIGNNFSLFTVNGTISGGTFGPGFRSLGGIATLVGGELQLNGVPHAGTLNGLTSGDVVTGTFADGSPFLFAQGTDAINGFALIPAPLPPIDTTPIVIDGSTTETPRGLRTGQTLTIRDGGLLPGSDFAGYQATLNVEGGTLEPSLEVSETAVSISGGTLDSLRVYRGSTVNVTGGTPSGVTAYDSTVVVGGGEPSGFTADAGSVIEVIGGTATGLTAVQGGTINVNGGTANGIEARSNSTVNISSGATSSIRAGDAGTANVYGGTVESVTAYSGGTANIHSDVGDVTLTSLFFDGAFGATVTIHEGTVDRALSYAGGTLNVRGGEVGTLSSGVDSFVEGSITNVTGGTVHVDESYDFFDGTVFTIDGGTVVFPETISINGDAVLNVRDGDVTFEGSVAVAANGGRPRLNLGAGTIEGSLSAFLGGIVTMSGGTVEDAFSVGDGGTAHLIGTEFFLDGVPIDLSPGLTTTIIDRDVPLTGVLADGSPIAIDLSNVFAPEGEVIDEELVHAILTLTLVPEPGDYNGDGLIDAADHQAWQSSYGESVIPYSGADGNGDGVIDAADYGVWRDNLPADPPSVPEPAGVLLGLLATASLLRRRG